MKILQILALVLLIFGFNFFVKAQACGYTSITVYLSDNNGKPIKNAEFKFFDRNYDSEGLHKDNLMSWSEERNSYFGAEGMCGGHRNVKMEVSAEGFENFTRQVDLPLGWESFSIKLKRKGTNEETYFEPLAHFRGEVSPEKGILFSETRIILINKSKKQFQTITKGGRFALDVPMGDYKIEFINSEDFLPTVFEEKFLDKGSNFVEVVIKNKDNKEEK
jgi:hypothetical protein